MANAESGSNSTPSAPFAWAYVPAPNGKSREAMWAAPFDNEFRPSKTPNLPDYAIPALASIGEHVIANAHKYCPAYKVVRVVNGRTLNTKALLEDAMKPEPDCIVILDRRTGAITHVQYAFSEREGLISWFAREPQNEGGVLCYDRTKEEYYIEGKQQELLTCLGPDGTEVAIDEPHTEEHYHVDKHANAVMVYGE